MQVFHFRVFAAGNMRLKGERGVKVVSGHCRLQYRSDCTFDQVNRMHISAFSLVWKQEVNLVPLAVRLKNGNLPVLDGRKSKSESGCDKNLRGQIFFFQKKRFYIFTRFKWPLFKWTGEGGVFLQSHGLNI